MPNLTVRALGALALLTSLPACAAEIGWTLAPGADPAHVGLSLERTAPGNRSQNVNTVDVGTLAGIDMQAKGTVRFEMRHEAGTLSCTGTMHDRRGAGTCTFAADPRFADALAARGIARPNGEESYALAVHDAHLSLVDTLVQRGFPRPAVHEFVALTIHGATSQWVNAIADAGTEKALISDLIAYRVHGITGPWLQALLAADPALRGAGAEETVALKIHGVTPEWVRAMADAGYTDLAARELVAMPIHGVTPEFARAAAAMTPRPSANELVGRKLMGNRSWQ